MNPTNYLQTQLIYSSDVLFDHLTDPEDSPPFEFQLGALSHLRTYDQMRFGEFVRILGLGGVITFDYSEDPRRAKLVGCQDDYITFEGMYCRAQHILCSLYIIKAQRMFQGISWPL